MADNNAPTRETDRSQQVRQAIIRKIVKTVRDNLDLSNEAVLLQIEEETNSLFEQFSEVVKNPDQKAAPKKRRRDRQLRKEHVGRFFLRLIEGQMRKEGVHNSLIPVFAGSVEQVVSDDDYKKWTEKIKRLIEFGGQRGYDYDNIIDSKPGRAITEEIVQTYRKEIAKSAGFEKKMKNSLDQMLIKSINPDIDGDIDIEKTIDFAFKQFMNYLASLQKAAGKK
ncbi:MAG: hypothetical protein COV67_02580 [Nitrospinae bacterium CG11_big_fil_rev_8_21_14_0_20_56_8]|nr:MAG: hypothetical protein COV67_02580 [Nitrospinae bacterium CG11_big_fil_rev_8_21_14_0_20_56_8]